MTILSAANLNTAPLEHMLILWRARFDIDGRLAITWHGGQWFATFAGQCGTGDDLRLALVSLENRLTVDLIEKRNLTRVTHGKKGVPELPAIKDPK